VDGRGTEGDACGVLGVVQTPARLACVGGGTNSSGELHAPLDLGGLVVSSGRARSLLAMGVRGVDMGDNDGGTGGRCVTTAPAALDAERGKPDGV